MKIILATIISWFIKPRWQISKIAYLPHWKWDENITLVRIYFKSNTIFVDLVAAWEISSNLIEEWGDNRDREVIDMFLSSIKSVSWVEFLSSMSLRLLIGRIINPAR